MAQAAINEYVEAQTRTIARELDYAIALSFINMEALKYEELYRSNDSGGSGARKVNKANLDIKKLRKRV